MKNWAGFLKSLQSWVVIEWVWNSKDDQSRDFWLISTIFGCIAISFVSPLFTHTMKTLALVLSFNVSENDPIGSFSEMKKVLEYIEEGIIVFE